MEDVTLSELARRVETTERRFNDYIRKEVYERDVRELKDDIDEIKETQKWATRFIIAQFVIVIIGAMFWIIDRIPL